MSVTQQSATERVTADRGRFVARGVSTPKLVVAQAEGARVTDVDGRSFIDFAGGIGCQNTLLRLDGLQPATELHKCQATIV